MKTQTQTQVVINQQTVAVEGERNLLEVIRKAKVDLPTFCYHSELSIYGACRLCLVEVEGRGLVPACSTPPEAGMRIQTHTPEIREIRKVIVELLLANHDNNCPTCSKSSHCQLQSLARRLGIRQVRFKPTPKESRIDLSTPSLVRDPDKCVLCGDCVRVCSEIQGIGAIDFAYRGANVAVLPAFGKDLSHVECVYCGQCSRVCPTGALVPRSNLTEVWEAINDPKKKVVAQIAPAVRVALGEEFGYEPGVNTTGLMVAALKRLGFDKVFDTSFTADLTVLEESTEFLERLQAPDAAMPLLTSCCPAWVKYVEQYHPEMLNNLSSCKSPQQMFGSLAKAYLPAMLQVDPKDLVVVSIMPCTAKKFEAQRPEFSREELRDVDYVLTTQELARMIEESGLRYKQLELASFDQPFGFKTGAGVIFGNSGGVSEAVLRFVTEAVTGEKSDAYEFNQVRGTEGVREAVLNLKGREVRLAVVNGLKNAGKVLEAVKQGKAKYDLIEVMACPGGCIGGAGQPAAKIGARTLRRKGLYEDDKTLPLHKSQENPYITELYAQRLEGIGSEQAHHLLHTHYHSRRRMDQDEMPLVKADGQRRLSVSVCMGTSCYLRGSQILLQQLIKLVEDNGLGHRVQVEASFCFEQCSQGPTVVIDGQTITHATLEGVKDKLRQALQDPLEA